MTVLLPEIPEAPEISEERLANKGKGWLHQATDNVSGQSVFAEFAYCDQAARTNKVLIWYPPSAPGMRWIWYICTASEYQQNYTRD
jgi:hypothetical protein